ncbi:ATP-binding protein [Pedobacter nutrimenti]|uniref:histidine kinase n=1 Tax=Pedobacter nutrimenti TaxID=1241337 RepID=A0A318U7H9_9SPHI|nr:ATP-binding protein [Pedobacter nutrimenti]PYF70028.1 signal transduction histidine kinase [Pedobacter nutrimenti]
MATGLGFFNWSLKKVLQSETDAFNRARIKIIFCILLFSLIKVSIAVPAMMVQGETFQLIRAIFIFLLYFSLMKMLLSRPDQLKGISHFLICGGVLLVNTNIFFFSGSVNILTLQFTYMVILCSFYLLGKKFGVFYSICCCFPLMVWVLSRGNNFLSFFNAAHELASPAYEILILLNFVTIIIAHYLFYQAYMISIEEKSMLNKQLNVALKEAEHAAQFQSDFLSMMSHELRTPLNAVIGIANLLTTEPHRPEQEDNLKMLRFSALGLHHLINEVLDFNKLDAGHIELENIPFDLKELILNISASLGIKAKEKALDLNLEIDKNLHGLEMIGDPMRLAQILSNLIVNAIKFTTKGSVTIGVHLLERSARQIKVQFSVRDTGIGIDPQRQQAIFEPFVQESNSTARNFGGTGLGLAIVRRLVELFGSRIQMESRPGEGTSFVFDLIFSLAELQPSVSRADHAWKDISSLRIVVAEDNEMNQMLMRKILTGWGINAEFAENGTAVLDLLVRNKYDLILMDLHMPVMDGYETASRIRALSRQEQGDIPIIALTASVLEDTRMKLKLSGINDYVNKPFDLPVLREKLERLV